MTRKKCTLNVLFNGVLYTLVFKVAPTNAESLLKAIDATVDPVKACDKLYECIQRLTSQLVGLLGEQDSGMLYVYMRR